MNQALASKKGGLDKSSPYNKTSPYSKKILTFSILIIIVLKILDIKERDS